MILRSYNIGIKKPNLIKRPKKSDFIRITGKPNDKLDVFAIIKYCKDNGLPTTNVPEKIAKQFRM